MSLNGFYIIATGSAIAAACALLGSFLVLRKMAMVGDAISHAVLPGIVLAFLISGSRGNLIMLAGAAATGVLTTILIELLHKKARLQEDASIGITFTWLFALGVILVSSFTGQVDLDQECVLYGEIAYVPLDLIYLDNGLSLGPRPLWVGLALLGLVLLYILWGYKGLKISSFNAEYAASLGISTAFWHFSFMGLVSLTTVVSFESVGAILIVALLVVPPASAYLLTHKLKTMLGIAVLFGIVSAAGGYYLALVLNGSIAGAMVSVAGIIFTFCFGYSRWQAGRKKELPKLLKSKSNPF
jgi:manganese/zinc/iron transport system permease protein